ncbi:MAG: hypothetical protein K5686_04605 [Lachnospiraceae bacterium]|nr:hypothetical protein [Lachnospiraceae bacterium]
MEQEQISSLEKQIKGLKVSLIITQIICGICAVAVIALVCVGVKLTKTITPVVDQLTAIDLKGVTADVKNISDSMNGVDFDAIQDTINSFDIKSMNETLEALDPEELEKAIENLNDASETLQKFGKMFSFGK